MKTSYRLGAVTAGATALAVAATVLVGAPALADDGPVEAGIYVEKVDGLSADFIRGADISSVIALEESGVVFRDENGDPADVFDVLADHGVNYIRARVWNNPFDAEGNGYGGGNNDVARTLEIGQRATEAGMKLLVDFHYSDFWAHPGQQPSPKAWVGMNLADRTDALHDFTAATLQTLEDGGVDVGMVQIGNETSAGAIAGVTGWANTAQLFQAGSEAVREVLPDALVAVHFTNPEQAGAYAGYAQQLDNYNVDYDVFASSYYPYWHGSLANLTSVLSNVATTYDKKVMVAEVSWASSLVDGDGHENSIRASNITDDYPATVQGQATAVRDVIAAVANVGAAGIGVFYWEPAWIPVPGDTLAERQAKWEEFGSGWAASYAGEYSADAGEFYGGSSWENQAMFDYSGNPLESLSVWNYVYTGATAPREVVGVESPTITVTQGDPITLPTTVEVSYNDTSTEDVAVTWNDVLSWITSPGTYTVNGVTADGDATTATVVVKAENLLVNGDFESGAMSPWWTYAVDWPSTGWIAASAGNNAKGTYAVNFYDGGAYDFKLGQDVALEAGTYTLRGSAHGENVAPQLYVTTPDGTVTANFSLSGWQQWKTPSITFTLADAASVTVGAQGSDDATSWSWYDDFELVLATDSSVDTGDLEALVDQMNGLSRGVYSTESLAVLDSALEVANIVLAAASPTAPQVADATALVQAAFEGLVIVGEVPDPTVNPVVVTAVEGDEITLPSEVTVTLFDGRTEQHAVTWDDVLGWIDGPGEYTVHGVTDGGLAATATVTVTERNWVVNGSFEDADTSAWSITGDGAAIAWSADAADGDYAVPFWFGSAYSFAVTQQVTGLPAGSYVLSATSQGGDSPSTDTRTLSLTSGANTGSAAIALDGWQAWATATTEPVVVGEDGTATVSAAFTLTSGAWGTIDDFRLVRIADDVDTAALEAALEEADDVNRELYTEPTLAALDAAVAGATVLLQGDRPSQSKVDAAATAIGTALEGLDLIDVAFTTAPTPTITGTAKYGSTLSVSAGTWVPTPSGIAYQWFRNGAPIAGATGITFKPALGDIGKQITVSVTASKADYITATKTSSAVTIGKGVFTTTPKPAIAGTPIAGKKLTAIVGIWAPKATSYTYQWYRDGKAISGQKAKTYTVKSTDLGHKITVAVTGSRTGYASAKVTSASVTIVKKFASTGRASISGTAKVGSTLTGHRGIWSPTPSSYGFQWLRNGVAISGATSTTYKLTSADKGKKVTVRVTAKKSGYLPTSVVATAVTVK